MSKPTLALGSAAPCPLYDPFLFVDSLTNRSIPLKEIRRSQPPSHRLSRPQEDQ